MTDTVTSETPRIYVASLSDYNAGVLHGTWITLDDEALDDDTVVWRKVEAMLAASPTYRDFPDGGPAEEWAIHDHEHLWSGVGEFTRIATIMNGARLIAEHGDAARAWLSLSPANVDYVDAFEDQYRGSYESEAEMHREHARDLVLDQMTSAVKGGDAEGLWSMIEDFVDEDALGESICGDLTTVEYDGVLYAFGAA